MFDQLSDRLQATLSDVRSRGKLSEGDVDAAMREIRLALLEADVNFKVVKAFTKTLKERCLGSEVLESLDPGQQVVKIVNEELAGADGRHRARAGLRLQRPDRDPDGRPAGLGQDDRLRQARPLPQGGRARTSPSPPATSTGPAAVEQLVTVGERAGAHVYEQGTDADPVEIAAWALEQRPRRAPRRADRRHRRPPPHRRGPDGRAGADPQADQARTTSSSSSTR